MKHASYRDAIRWLADNDDNSWLDRHDMDGMLTPSVAACLVEDLFGVSSDKIVTDLRRALEPVEPKPRKSGGKAKGGYARAASLTAQRRQEIAREAAKTRWGNRRLDLAAVQRHLTALTGKPATLMDALAASIAKAKAPK